MNLGHFGGPLKDSYRTIFLPLIPLDPLLQFETWWYYFKKPLLCGLIWDPFHSSRRSVHSVLKRLYFPVSVTGNPSSDSPFCLGPISVSYRDKTYTGTTSGTYVSQTSIYLIYPVRGLLRITSSTLQQSSRKDFYLETKTNSTHSPWSKVEGELYWFFNLFYILCCEKYSHIVRYFSWLGAPYFLLTSFGSFPFGSISDCLKNSTSLPRLLDPTDSSDLKSCLMVLSRRISPLNSLDISQGVFVSRLMIWRVHSFDGL